MGMSPNVSIVVFEAWLDGIGDCARRCAPRPIIVAGDFNAKSTAWGSLRSDVRGGLVEEWAEELGLILLNVGGGSTLVRSRGESVVDLTWATPGRRHDLCKIGG